MQCTKIILSSYKNLDRVIKAIEEDINERCVGSYFDNRCVERIFDDVLKLFERKYKLLDLKRKVDKVFSLLSDQEKDLLFCKYLDISPKTKFNFSLRTYFRKQVKLLEKLDEYFSFIGINDEDFFKDFSNDRFIKCAKIKTDDVKRIACAFYSNCEKDKLPGADRKKERIKKFALR